MEVFYRTFSGGLRFSRGSVPVPDVLRFLTYADGYGQFALARERSLEIPDDIRAIRCSDCSKCSVECPNGVRVRDRVMRAQELFA